jgi:hypothetical protein
LISKINNNKSTCTVPYFKNSIAQKQNNKKLVDLKLSSKQKIEFPYIKVKGPGLDDADLKKIMPGIDTSKKTLDQISLDEKLELSINIDELVDMVNQSIATGEQPKFFNLCSIIIPGTNLYCNENLGIHLNDMPQFKGRPIPGSIADKMPKNSEGDVDGQVFFEEFLKNKDIEVNSGINGEGVSVPPELLKATQMIIIGSKVAYMYLKLEKDPANPLLNAPIFVSSDGYVLDGHHRWAAIIAYNVKNPSKAIPIKVIIINEPIISLVKQANEYANYLGIEHKIE